MTKAKGRKNIYDDYVRKVMHTVFDNNNSAKKRDYERAVAEMLGEYFTVDQVHSNVSRAIDRLVDNDEMIYLGNHIFAPMSNKYRNFKLEKDIQEKVKLTKSKILVISENIFAVAIDEEQIKTDSYTVRECFRNLLGADKCYSVSVLNDVVIIMLNPVDKHNNVKENIAIDDRHNSPQNNDTKDVGDGKEDGKSKKKKVRKNEIAEYLQNVVREAYGVQQKKKAQEEKDKLKAICRKQREFAKKQK